MFVSSLLSKNKLNLCLIMYVSIFVSAKQRNNKKGEKKNVQRFDTPQKFLTHKRVFLPESPKVVSV